MLTVESSLEKETNHLWWLGSSLTQAVAAGDRDKADELIEAIDVLAQLSEYLPVRAKALSLANQARLIGPAELVAFKVAETTVTTAASAEVAVGS